MRSTCDKRLAWLTVATVLALATVATATPDPNGAAIHERVFNDCPSSVLTTTNNYPMYISFHDAVLDCGGFANLHVWHLSEDGGVTDAVFSNADSFRFGALLTINGTSEGEAGLQLAPWWSQMVDGRFNVRSTDGEIACFGGRLPFYSFTVSQGLTYSKGDQIYLEIVYLANSNTEANPATIEYKVVYGGSYTSGPLPFDEGNPAEDPPYGLWGCLNDARVGGFTQMFLQAGNPVAELQAEWEDIQFEEIIIVSNEMATWGKVKSLYR